MIHVFSYCNFQGKQYTDETKVLFYSAKVTGYTLTMLGRDDTDFNTYKRIEEYKKVLDKLEPNAICLFVDATDTFFAQSPQTTLEKFLALDCDVLFSAEKWFSWQDYKYQDYFHKAYPDSGYRYLNAGNIMGKAFAMGLFFQKVLDFYKDPKNEEPLVYKKNDQTAFGSYIAIKDALANKKVQLDYQCRVFYNPTDDWDIVYEHLKKTRNYKKIHVADTIIQPCIVHVSFKQKYDHVYQQFYHSMRYYSERSAKYIIIIVIISILIIISLILIIFASIRK